VRRARWSQHGGRWGPPGGARDSHESAAEAALRETVEECGPLPAITVHGLLTDDHGGWSYQTFAATAADPAPVRAASLETAQARWIPAGDVAGLPLHPGFESAWPVLRRALEPVTLIIDAANVMGSRPDGWWRDRAAAVTRLRADLAPLAADGLDSLPGDGGDPPLDRWFPDFVLVIEGKARAAGDVPEVGGAGTWPLTLGGTGPVGDGAPDGVPVSPRPLAGSAVRVVAAPGSGDDTIAELAASTPGGRIVVTADRGLRERCSAAGARVVGPRWLLGLLG
jgi:8-oxo-dGTP diphosphatase